MLKKDVAGSFALALAQRFREVEALGLPSLKEERRVQLNDIYVPLRLTWDFGKRREPDNTFYVPEALEKQKHIVVLGDPGSGKSTLIGVLTYSFGRSGSTPFKRLFGELLPIPVILRDYKVRQWKSYHDLLRDFVNSNLVQSSIDDAIRPDITPEFLLTQLRDGKAILMLDGLDEVGSSADRLHLRDKVVFPLLAEARESYVVLTTRMVGYDEAPFDARVMRPDGWDDFAELSKRSTMILGTASLVRCYVAPFTDEDIEQFITRWYQAREPFPDKQREGIESLKQALSRNDRVRRLAENPSLLTLIALIHRVTANLPSGRVNLYDKIVEAYLETIQNYRKLSVPASLDEMKRWLAHVGWKMQERREQEDEEDLLVHRREVLAWLTDAIAERRDREAALQDAEAFLEYVARRSGLLIPRGPEEFSFVHLTFQEYFAAYTLRGKVRRFDRLVQDCIERLPLHYWHETLGVLFEMLTEFDGACDDLFEELRTFAASSNDEVQAAAAQFFSELLLDEQNGLSSNRVNVAAEFVLTEICRELNDKVIQNLKNLPPPKFVRLVEQWFAGQLQTTPSDKLGRHFFVSGNGLLEDWPQRLAQWVAAEPNRKLDDLQVAQVALFAAADINAYQQVSRWVVERVSLLRWLAPINSHYSYWFLSLADVYRKEIDALPETVVRRRLLLESRALATIRNGQLFRLRTFIFTLVRARDFARAHDFARAFVFGLNRARERTLEFSRGRTLELARAHGFDLGFDLGYANTGDFDLAHAYAYTLDFDLAQVLDPDFDLAHAHAHDPGLALGLDLALGRTLAQAGVLSSPRPELKNLPVVADAEWLLFAPNASAEVFDSITADLSSLTPAQDDWTRLQGLAALLTLGAGSPKLFAEQNALIEKGIKQPDQFTFPLALQAETETPEFRAQLPDLFKLIFLHDPDDPKTHWLQPEFFDPSHPASKYFLSNPHEFFILAADALDPSGETELGQWRRKVEEIESSL